MEHFLIGLHQLVAWQNLLALVAGSLIGMVIGAMPGLGPSIGVALLLPFTYNMPAVSALLLLASLYQAAEYGGSISSVLLSTPGTPAAAATVLDGYALNRKGFPGKALGYSLTASTLGGFFGVFVLIALAAPLATVALRFGPPEYFALGVFGLTAVASLSGDDPVKGVLSAIFGLLLTTVGIDVFTGFPRYNFGRPELLEGIPLLPVLIGLFAVSEVFRLVGEELSARYEGGASGLRVWVSWQEFRKVLRPALVGSIIGAIVGIFPGMGAGPASWLAYNEARRMSKHPETFGTGNPEGIAGPEAANNAAVGGAMVPLITLGIPGSPTTAVILGALIIHGIQPGPQVFSKNPDIVYGLFAGLLAATAMMWVFGLLTTNLWAHVVKIPNTFLAPIVLILAVVGAYVTRNMLFDVWLALLFGAVGYAMRKAGFSLPSTVLGFVLGFMTEANLRRSLLMSDGSYGIFLNRPVALIILILAVASLISSIQRQRKMQRKTNEAAGTAIS